ncbi:MAG TPA: hypothetical protein VGK18_15780 [Propionicimonas sp.]|jgi:hypothetical protein|uniref:hypothetical protein n=1 Tax=Propionicimonas sp. TaxID=1955623 RepID=UPI002F421D82
MKQLTTPTPAAGGDPIVDLSKAPMPTAKTLKMRQSLPFQFTRFLSFNSRIMRMVIKGHH